MKNAGPTAFFLSIFTSISVSVLAINAWTQDADHPGYWTLTLIAALCSAIAFTGIADNVEPPQK